MPEQSNHPVVASAIPCFKGLHHPMFYGCKHLWHCFFAILVTLTVACAVKGQAISAEDFYNRLPPNNDKYENAEQAFGNKKYDQAISLFKQIVTDDPADFQAWSELGTVYLTQKKTNDAEAAYLHALEARPSF